MKVLICSDSHGRLDYFQQLIDLEQPEIVIFGGETTLEELEKKAHLEKAEICVFGHTHKEFMAEKGGIIFVNPGALQDKKYMVYYGGKKFEQKILK